MQLCSHKAVQMIPDLQFHQLRVNTYRQFRTVCILSAEVIDISVSPVVLTGTFALDITLNIVSFLSLEK